MSETGIFILVFYLSDIGCKQVGNDCCVGVYHGRQTLVQDLKEEVLTLKLRSLKHFLGNGRCVNYIEHVCLALYCMIRYMLQIEPTVDDCCVLSYQTDS